MSIRYIGGNAFTILLVEEIHASVGKLVYEQSDASTNLVIRCRFSEFGKHLVEKVDHEIISVGFMCETEGKRFEELEYLVRYSKVSTYVLPEDIEHFYIEFESIESMPQYLNDNDDEDDDY